MDVLGHSQLSITMDLYSDVMPVPCAMPRRDGSGAERKPVIGVYVADVRVRYPLDGPVPA
jgi:hypothetical protein